MEFSKEDLMRLYRNLVLGRRLDRKMIEAFHRRKMPGFYHSGMGHDAVLVGCVTFCRPGDWFTLTHRGFGAHVCRGVPIGPIIAELYGRSTGTAKGKGGEHKPAFDYGIVGGSGTVGGSFPVATGLGLAAQKEGRGQVVVSLFGDGGAQRGTLHESMNWASVLKLPIIWLCENNLYAVGMPMRKAMAIQDIADLAASYGMPGAVVDGQDVLAVARAFIPAMERARKGEGPTLLECKTFRFREHGESDGKSSYMLPGEREAWMKRDPVKLYRDYLLGAKVFDGAALDAVDEQAQREIDEAEAWAEASPRPRPEQAFEDLWAD